MGILLIEVIKLLLVANQTFSELRSIDEVGLFVSLDGSLSV